MSMRWYAVVVDCHDIAAQARWWAETLDYRIVYEDDDEVDLLPPGVTEEPIADAGRWAVTAPALVFVPVPEGKTVKNRLHIDLAPHTSQDRDAEIAALIERGASHVEVGQSAREGTTWTVLADPEGNEFCVLSSRDH